MRSAARQLTPIPPMTARARLAGAARCLTVRWFQIDSRVTDQALAVIPRRRGCQTNQSRCRRRPMRPGRCWLGGYGDSLRSCRGGLTGADARMSRYSDVRGSCHPRLSRWRHAVAEQPDGDPGQAVTVRWSADAEVTAASGQTGSSHSFPGDRFTPAGCPVSLRCF